MHHGQKLSIPTIAPVLKVRCILDLEVAKERVDLEHGSDLAPQDLSTLELIEVHPDFGRPEADFGVVTRYASGAEQTPQDGAGHG